MKKIKNFFQKLKEWWHVPRYHSIMILCFYLLFFTTVFIYIDAVRIPSKEEPTDFWTTYQAMNNYEYQLVIMENQITYHINGTRNQTEEQFRIRETGERYSVVDGKIKGEVGQTELNEVFSFSLLSLRPESIGMILKGKEPITEIKYQNGTIKQEYEIENSMLGFREDKTSLVTVIYQGTKLESIKIEGMVTIELTYQNIGSITQIK